MIYKQLKAIQVKDKNSKLLKNKVKQQLWPANAKQTSTPDS